MQLNEVKAKRGFEMEKNILKNIVYIYLTLTDLDDLITKFLKVCSWSTLVILRA